MQTPDLSKHAFFDPDGTPRVMEMARAPDYLLDRHFTMMTPAARRLLKERMVRYRNDATQSARNMSMGFEAERQRARVMAVLDKLGSWSKEAAPVKPHKPSLLKRVKDYVSGRAMASPQAVPGAAPMTVPQAVAEEGKELGRSARLRKWTLGMSDRPGFHIRDRLLGAVPGAAMGLMADEALGHSDDESRGSRLGRKALAMAGGAYLGGKALNMGMNVGRRYVSNTSPLFGYNNADIPKFTLKGLWNHGILDRQADFSTRNASQSLVNTGQAQARHELLRRYMGVHKDDHGKDLFTRNRDGSLSFNTGVVKPGHPLFGALETGAKGQAGLSRERPYSADTRENPFEGIFGSHHTAKLPDAKNTYRVSDVWNFNLDPHEAPYLRQYAGGLAKTSPNRWGEYLNQPHAHPGEEGKTVGQFIRGTGTRQLVESVLRQHTPVVRSDIRTLDAPASGHAIKPGQPGYKAPLPGQKPAAPVAAPSIELLPGDPAPMVTPSKAGPYLLGAAGLGGAGLYAHLASKGKKKKEG